MQATFTELVNIHNLLYKDIFAQNEKGENPERYFGGETYNDFRDFAKFLVKLEKENNAKAVKEWEDIQPLRDVLVEMAKLPKEELKLDEQAKAGIAWETANRDYTKRVEDRKNVEKYEAPFGIAIKNETNKIIEEAEKLGKVANSQVLMVEAIKELINQ